MNVPTWIVNRLNKKSMQSNASTLRLRQREDSEINMKNSRYAQKIRLKRPQDENVRRSFDGLVSVDFGMPRIKIKRYVGVGRLGSISPRLMGLERQDCNHLQSFSHQPNVSPKINVTRRVTRIEDNLIFCKLGSKQKNMSIQTDEVDIDALDNYLYNNVN